MTEPARCECGEFAPIRLVKWLHGEDADLCSECWRKRQNRITYERVYTGAPRPIPVHPKTRDELLVLFDEEKRMASPHRQGCRLCRVTPCG